MALTSQQDSNTKKMGKVKIVELVLFKLNEGVSLEEGKKSMKALSAFVQTQPGFVSRKTSVSKDGHFLDLVFWTDLALAQQASEKAMQNEDLLKHFSVINQETMTFDHFEVFHEE